MSSTTITDGDPHSADAVTRLTQLADRTCLMAIDAALRASHDDGVKALLGLTAANAADDVRAMARRMLQATLDFRATIQEPAD